MSYKVKTRPHVLLKLDNTTAVAYINKKWGRFPSLVTSWRKTFGTGTKSKIFRSLVPMYLRLRILLLISGHVFVTITKSGL